MLRLLCALVVAGALFVAADGRAQDSSGAANPRVQVDLQIQLEKGLKCRRPVEFEFVEHVVELVAEGTLPRSLVDSTFLWARRQGRYPFPYFQRGLKVRAARLGISI